MESSDTFYTVPGFCGDCGSILPMLREQGNVTCYSCNRVFGPEVFGDMKINYKIHFNSRDSYARIIEDKNKMKEKESDGPVIERRCPKCNNDKMSYVTLQLRSADEGQTVFYTCTACKYKENENS